VHNRGLPPACRFDGLAAQDAPNATRHGRAAAKAASTRTAGQRIREASPNTGVGKRSMDQSKQIKQFVLKNYLFTEDETALADDESLIRGGIVDSTGMLELISHLEESYAIKVENAEMIPANFDSIATISRFVASKRSA
jgi:acyl carrier protein